MVYDKKLCSRCSDYFSSESFWHMSYGRELGYLFQRSFLNLKENSSECTMCEFIHEALLQACKRRGPRERRSIDSDDVLYYSRVLHGEFDTDTAPDSHQTFRLRVSTDFQYTISGNLDISVIRYFQRPARGKHIEIDVARLGERMFLQGRRMEQRPDTDLVKSWLQFCCEERGSRCDSEPINSYTLINVDAMMVEQMKTKPRYAALSYVWGKDSTKHFRLTEDLRAVLSTPGSLDESRQDIPLVFLDAIQLCRTLGIDYLWIDSLCHDKKRTTLSKELPTEIAQIYSNAFVTIVASGKDAHSGLPGISTNREVQLTRQFGETTIAVVQPQIDVAMAESDWMKRGWTFDEYVRSHHLLVVTDDQLYFKCKKQDIIFCEDMWYESPDYLGTTMRKIELPSVDGLWGWKAVDDDKGFFAYTLAVYEYFSRQMTQQKDLAPGFDGWRESREKEIGKKFLYNLPVSEFARALCFELRGCERRKPEKDWSNNSIYTPSWSWQGWVGSENDMIEYINAWSFDTPSMQFYRFRKDGNAQEGLLFPFPEQIEPTKEDLEIMLGMLSMWRKLSQTHPEKLSRYWKAEVQRLEEISDVDDGIFSVDFKTFPSAGECERILREAHCQARPVPQMLYSLPRSLVDCLIAFETIQVELCVTKRDYDEGGLCHAPLPPSQGRNDIKYFGTVCFDSPISRAEGYLFNFAYISTCYDSRPEDFFIVTEKSEFGPLLQIRVGSCLFDEDCLQELISNEHLNWKYKMVYLI